MKWFCCLSLTHEICSWLGFCVFCMLCILVEFYTLMLHHCHLRLEVFVIVECMNTFELICQLSDLLIIRSRSLFQWCHAVCSRVAFCKLKHTFRALFIASEAFASHRRGSLTRDTCLTVDFSLECLLMVFSLRPRTHKELCIVTASQWQHCSWSAQPATPSPWRNCLPRFWKLYRHPSL